jgi:hypothetical protein
MLIVPVAVLLAFCAAPAAHAADATTNEMDAVLKRQGETVEQNRRKLDQSIRANESDRKRAMGRAQRRLERDAASSSPTARRK